MHTNQLRTSLLLVCLLGCERESARPADADVAAPAAPISRYVHSEAAIARSKEIATVRTSELAIVVKAKVAEGLPVVSLFLAERPYGSDGFVETGVEYLRPWADSVRSLLSGAWTVQPGESESVPLPMVPSLAAGTFLLHTRATNEGGGNLDFLLMLANDPSSAQLSQIINRRSMERLLSAIGAAADSADQMAAVNLTVPYVPLGDGR